MLINITNLVNDRVLPFLESNAIVGLANISSVCEWYLVENVSPALVAMFHDAGVFPTLILTSGYVIAGSGHIFGETDYAKAIEKDIKACSFTSDPSLGLPA
jgi:hypothetical protein